VLSIAAAVIELTTAITRRTFASSGIHPDLPGNVWNSPVAMTITAPVTRTANADRQCARSTNRSHRPNATRMIAIDQKVLRLTEISAAVRCSRNSASISRADRRVVPSALIIAAAEVLSGER
jgi:hypothetical protein